MVRNGEPHAGDDVFHDDRCTDEVDSEQTRLLSSATAAESTPTTPQPLTSQNAPVVIQNPSETFVSNSALYEEVVLKVERRAGAGLGISIAGGVGSTPYRSNDHVCMLYVICLFLMLCVHSRYLFNLFIISRMWALETVE